MPINRFAKLVPGSQLYFPRHSNVFVPPSYDNLEEKTKSGVILIRHARSETNEIIDNITKEPTTVDVIRNQMFKRTQIDSGLSELGIGQSIEAAQHAHQINF